MSKHFAGEGGKMIGSIKAEIKTKETFAGPIDYAVCRIQGLEELLSKVKKAIDESPFRYNRNITPEAINRIITGIVPDYLGEKRAAIIGKIKAYHPEIREKALTWFLDRINELAGPPIMYPENREIRRKAKVNYEKILDLSNRLRKELEIYIRSDFIGPPPADLIEISQEKWRDEVYPVWVMANNVWGYLFCLETKMATWPERSVYKKTPIKGSELRQNIFVLAMQFDALKIPGIKPSVSKDGESQSLFQQIVSILWPEAKWRAIQTGIKMYRKGLSAGSFIRDLNPYVE